MYVGVLPFAIYRNKIYLLLGREKYVKDWRASHKWSDFGGRLEKGEKIKEGAAREFYEESMGLIVGSKEEALAMLDDQLCYRGPNSIIYLVLVPFNPTLPIIFKNVYNYITDFALSKPQNCNLKIIKGQINLPEEGFFEKVAINWIPIDQVDLGYGDDRYDFFRFEFLKSYPKIRKVLEAYLS